MRILVTSPAPIWPLVYGGAVRSYHLLSAIAETNQVTLLYLQEEPHESVPKQLRDLCEVVHVFSPTYSSRAARLRSLSRASSFSRQKHFSATMNQWIAENEANFDCLLSEFTHTSWIPTRSLLRVVNLHNLEGELIWRTAQTDTKLVRKLYRYLDGLLLERDERKSLHSADLIWVTSEREKQLLRSKGIRRPCHVIANGVDWQFFAQPTLPLPTEQIVPELVFVGITHYYPNHQGMIWFLQRVWPLILAQRPQTTLAVIGGDPLPELNAYHSPQIQILGYIPEILPYYQNAKLTIVPLLSGSGTRFKLLESAATGTPIVTTTLGCEGIPVQNEKHCLIENDPIHFAQACLRLLNDPNLCTELSQNAQKMVRQQYDWRLVGEKARQTIEQLEERHLAPAFAPHSAY